MSVQLVIEHFSRALKNIVLKRGSYPKISKKTTSVIFIGIDKQY